MGIELDLNTNDPEALAAMFNKLESGEEPAAPSETPDPPLQDEETQATTATPTGTTEQADADPDPAGIATKDGKHVIPYSVLKSERDRATRAEQIARETQERLAALEEQVKAANQGAKTGESARTESEVPEASDLSSEDLEALKEDFPTVYKAVMASMAAAKALESKLAPVEESVRNAEAERAATATETVQEAIDAVPKLAHIQATDPEAFALAQQFDATLRKLPQWQNKSLSERFAKVTSMVEDAMGEIDVPGAKPASQNKPSAEDLRKAALEKAANSAKSSRTAVPVSLSEIPAGEPAAIDEREAAENMTPQQLAELFSKMTPEQQDAYFQSL